MQTSEDMGRPDGRSDDEPSEETPKRGKDILKRTTEFPESDRENAFAETTAAPLPEDLQYLIEPAIRLAEGISGEEDIWRFLETADESVLEELAALAERVRLEGAYPRLIKWWQSMPVRQPNNILHHMDIYFLFGLMDACDMAFEDSSECPGGKPTKRQRDTDEAR